MSFPSIQECLEAEGVTDLEEASPDQLHRAYIAAFDKDLPLGMVWLRQKASHISGGDHRHLFTEDPSSPLGRQLIRLCGADIARKHVSRELGVAIGFYNCCNVVVAPNADMLDMSDIEQIQLQNGVLASADC